MNAPRPILTRLIEKVDWESPGECWEWTAAKAAEGYGVISVTRTVKRRAHRISYELFVGPIPAGLQLDHLCRNRACINPAHLEPVTNRENSLRGMSPKVITYRTGICQRGHSMEDAYIQNPKTGSRACRTCVLENQRRRKREKKAAGR